MVPQYLGKSVEGKKPIEKKPESRLSTSSTVSSTGLRPPSYPAPKAPVVQHQGNPIEKPDAIDSQFLKSLDTFGPVFSSAQECEIWHELTSPGYLKSKENQQSRGSVGNTPSPVKSKQNIKVPLVVSVDFAPVSLYKDREQILLALKKDGMLVVSLITSHPSININLDISKPYNVRIDDDEVILVSHFVLDGLPVRFEGRLNLDTSTGKATIYALSLKYNN